MPIAGTSKWEFYFIFERVFSGLRVKQLTIRICLCTLSHFHSRSDNGIVLVQFAVAEKGEKENGVISVTQAIF